MSNDLRRQVAAARGWLNLRDEIIETREDGSVFGFLFGEHPKTTLEYQVPNYDTDISAAWELVSEMREYDCDITIESAGDGWCIRHALFPGNGYSQIRQSAPEAIATAYLLFLDAKSGGSK